MNTARPLDIELLRTMPLPVVHGETDKNSRGRVLVVGGSRRVPGAIVLSGMSALRVGAGKIQLAVPNTLSIGIGLTALEAGICPLQEDSDGEPIAAPNEQLKSAAQQVDAVVIGPGIMNQQSAHELVRALLSEVVGPIYVIDALALCGLWDETDLLRAHAGRVILTPHSGEMAQLRDVKKEDVDADPNGVAREAAAHLSSVIVLKGATTYIVTPSGLTYIHTGGVPGLATAGSGDVLAGIIAGIASRGAPPTAAAVWAVFLHGRAGTRLSENKGKVGFISRELTEALPAVLDAAESSTRA
jgi:hydroxyethylthiazole kinase-like uncharacterized protein yjeF